MNSGEKKNIYRRFARFPDKIKLLFKGFYTNNNKGKMNYTNRCTAETYSYNLFNRVLHG